MTGSLRLRHALWALSAIVVGATPVMVGDNPFTTYGGIGSWWTASEALAAAALVVASVVAAAGGHARLAVSLGATAVLLVAVEWGGWAAGPAWARTVADASAGALAAGLIVAVVDAAGVDGRARRAVLTAAWAGAASVALTRLVLLDPFRDSRCWRLCRPNPLAVTETMAPGRLVLAFGTATLLAGGLTALVLIAMRPRHKVLAVGTAAMLGGLATSSVAGLVVAVDPRRDLFRFSFAATIAGAGVVAVAVVLQRLREWRLRAALYRVIDQLQAASPGSLEQSLAVALDDPELRLVYWSPVKAAYVDWWGQAAGPPAAEGRAVTTIVRGGEPVATIQHRSSIDSARIERVIGPAVRLSLENEQLQAATRAELAELQASRARIVERADLERRRLERNLHDGAQQRIVGIALLLRVLENRRPASVDETFAGLLERAERSTAATLDGLRRLARGIHPAVLTDGGLHAAVFELAESSTDVAVQVEALPRQRQPAPVEAAAYLVVAEAVEDARRRTASTVTVHAGVLDGTLYVELVDDAPPAAAGHTVTDLDDRIGALGGQLVVTSTGTGTRVRLDLPCAS